MKTRNVRAHARSRAALPWWLALLLTLALAACQTGAGVRSQPPAGAAQAPLTVALYPYVPRKAQFEQAIAREWAAQRPGVPLRFLPDSQWDGGYKIDPPAEADVFVFDAMFFENFRSRSLLEALRPDEVNDLDDFVSYALEGVRYQNHYYAIPQLGCANVLFYQRGDRALGAARTLSELKSALGQCSYTSQIPPDKRGLLMDMSSGTTDATLYLNGAYDLSGRYPFPLPRSRNELDPTTIANLRKLLTLGSYENATEVDENKPYQFAQWYSNGWGRAYVGFTESMSAMSPAARAEIEFKLLPFSDTQGGSALFFADVIAVNPRSNARGTRTLAVQLANVMAASRTFVAATGASGGQDPQFLMATRPSAFRELARQSPIYERMQGLLNSTQPRMFKAPAEVRDWLGSMKDTIKGEMLGGLTCGCSYKAVRPIANNAQAPQICVPTCQAHGGWSGQWTNQYPAAQDGSVCGCNRCD